ncbi:SpoIIE family protein phosphatase [Salirhabdus sp. Marseille-P4669]|uniref:SpoIIE family protein phosphatase n=1 Tax=Salirhabdus sp. Marseille-P4669 TaxID=2042310 RepID=UPI000C7B320C|nr:SpoIIE family protein phosphatase [Salirhabdus sp. Marseille-P4669]
MSTNKKRIDVAVFQQAKQGNFCCGDSFFTIEKDSKFICVLADGLGSGKMAKESSAAVVEVVQHNPLASMEEIIANCNNKLMDKRGAVIGILMIDLDTSTYALTSIGNIGIVSISPNGQQVKSVPTYGYLSGGKHPFHITNGDIEPGQVFLMYSDGVKDKELLKQTKYLGNIDHIVKYYEGIHKQTDEKDDTTLIVLKYK